MNKTEILAIGAGGCGNNLLDDLLTSDKKFSGIFFNTNIREMENKRNFDKQRRCFYIPNADGTGKDRKITESYIKVEAPKFVEVICKFTGQQVVEFFNSANGGTGSKASTMLPRLIKKVTPDKIVNITASMPSISETDIDFENAIDFWNELIDNYDKGYVNSIRLIDNNKLSSEKEINKAAIESYNDMFSIVGDKIDYSDLSRLFKTRGYNFTLKLNNRITDTSEAIDDAINNSVYYIPDNTECDVLVATVNTRYFDVNVIKEKFPTYDFQKINETQEGDTIISLAGCDIPKEPIELIQEALTELRKKKRDRERQANNNLKVNNNLVRKENKVNKEVAVSSKDLDELFEDDDFWN